MKTAKGKNDLFKSRLGSSKDLYKSEAAADEFKSVIEADHTIVESFIVNN